MAKYSNYSALSDLVKVFNSGLMVFNPDLVVSFSLFRFIVFAKSSGPPLSQVYLVLRSTF